MIITLGRSPCHVGLLGEYVADFGFSPFNRLLLVDWNILKSCGKSKNHPSLIWFLMTNGGMMGWFHHPTMWFMIGNTSMTGMMSVMPVIVCFHGMVTMAARVALGDSHMNGIPNISRRTTWWISSNTKPNPNLFFHWHHKINKFIDRLKTCFSHQLMGYLPNSEKKFIGPSCSQISPIYYIYIIYIIVVYIYGR